MSFYSGLRARVRAMFASSRADADLLEEIQHHIALETAHNVAAGMSASEAHRQAVAHFGGVDAVREQHRDVRRPSWLADFVSDTRFAWRGLRRTPAATSAA